GRGRKPNLESLQSFRIGECVCLQVAACVVAGRYVDEMFGRGCICVLAGMGSWNRAVEYAGWRKRVFEYVRCGAVCRTALVPTGSVLVLCGAFLCLKGIGAPAVTASPRIPIQVKNFRLIIYPSV